MKTEEITLALAIPTVASWRPERRKSLDRLREDLGISEVPTEASSFSFSFLGADGIAGPELQVFFLEHDNRSPREVWCAHIQEWGIRTGATHFVQLQDDMRVAPDKLFWKALLAMIVAHPHEIINLQAVHQDTPKLAREGFSGYTTVDGMPGPAYAIPTDMLREFRGWARTSLVDGALQAVPEDTLLGIFAMVTRRRIWSPIPTIVDHPGDAGSTYGNEKAIRQRPLVRWDNWADMPVGQRVSPERLASHGFWLGSEPLGRFYDITPSIARRYVKGYTAADYARDMAVECRPLTDAPLCAFCGKANKGVISKETGALVCGICLRQASPLVGARFAKPGAPLLVVATPLKGHPHPAHADAISQLRAEETLNVEAPYEVAAWLQPSDDLVRVRSRIVRDVVNLRRAGKPVTHLLLVDGDVAPTPRVIHGMLAAKRPFVTAPYPLRVIDWRGVEKPDGRPAEARAYVYWHIERLPGNEHVVDEAGCSEIVGNGLGCALLEVELLERMVEHYGRDRPEPRLDAIRAEALHERVGEAGLHHAFGAALREAFDLGRRVGPPLLFHDLPMPGVPAKETVALFALEFSNGGQLLSEDKSFCRRVRAIGEKVWLYLGPGAPVDHYGEARFRGMPESFDIRPKAEKAAE